MPAGLDRQGDNRIVTGYFPKVMRLTKIFNWIGISRSAFKN
jgi:hypothetical protein